MKKTSLLCVLVIPFVVLGLLISCGNNGDVYFISASVDGTTYKWTLGVTDIEEDAFGWYITNIGSPRTLILATPETVSSVIEPSNYVVFNIYSSSTSPAIYTIEDFLVATYRINGVDWDFTNITFVITKYGAVGSTIEGTFSGTIFDGASTMTVTNGQFEVVRIADDT